MSNNLMICPKCGHEQPTGFPECVRCGVVFAKFRPREPTSETWQAEETAEEFIPVSLPDAYDVESARNALAVARQLLPAVESAYVPSGSVSLLGLLMLVMGGVLGTGLAVIGGALVWLAGGVAVKILVGLSGALFEFCELPLILLLLTVLVALFAYLLRILAVGWVVAFVIAQFGKIGKNRNVPAAAVLALVAGGLAGVVLVSAAPQFFPDLDLSTVEELAIEEPGTLIAGLDSLSGALAYWGRDGKWNRYLNIAGAILIALMACSQAADHVGRQKFCEKCSDYMVSTVLGRSSWQEGQRVAHAHWQKDFTALKSLLRPGRVGPCETTLYTCPRCWEGYVESTAEFFWSHKAEDRDDQVDDAWLFASTMVGRYDVRVLR